MKDTALIIVQPHKIGVAATVAAQRDATIRGRTTVDGEFVAARQELPARRWCRNNPNALMLLIVRLVHVSENHETNATERG